VTHYLLIRLIWQGSWTSQPYVRHTSAYTYGVSCSGHLHSLARVRCENFLHAFHKYWDPLSTYYFTCMGPAPNLISWISITTKFCLSCRNQSWTMRLGEVRASTGCLTRSPCRRVGHVPHGLPYSNYYFVDWGTRLRGLPYSDCYVTGTRLLHFWNHRWRKLN
jgi:hypothetical protein